MSRKWIIFRDSMVTVYSLLVTFLSGRWAIYAAYMERGYEGVGGEYLFILAAYIISYKCISWMFKNLEEERYGKKSEEKRGGAAIRL